MSEFLGGFLFGNVDSDDEDGGISQAMGLLGNMSDHLGFSSEDVKPQEDDSDSVIPDNTAVDYEDIDEVINASPTPIQKEEDYDAEDEKQESKETRPKLDPTQTVTPMPESANTRQPLNSFTIKRKLKRRKQRKVSQGHHGDTGIRKINLQRLFEGKQTVTPELRPICSALRGEDGNPILKYTELFASRGEGRTSKQQLIRSKKVDYPDSIQVFVESDENDDFEEGEMIQAEITETKQPASPVIYSVHDLLQNSSSSCEESDEEMESESITESEEENRLIHETKTHGPLFPTSGGYYEIFDQNDSSRLLLVEEEPVYDGIEQDLWEEKIHWDDSDQTEAESEAEASEPLDLDILREMKLWPPKQTALDITNEVEIELPQKRSYLEAMDEYSSSDDDEILEELMGTVPHSLTSSTVFSPVASHVASANVNASEGKEPEPNALDIVEDVTAYKLPYRNVLLEGGEWLEQIIWDGTAIHISKAPPILFDLNDKRMLFEDDLSSILHPKHSDSEDEAEPAPKDETEAPKTNEPEEEPAEELDPFNLSQDAVYVPRKSLRRKKIRKAKIYHSPVALKLSLVRPYLSKETLEYFHKPRTTTIPHNFPRKLQQIPFVELPKSVIDSGMFKKKEDLTASNGSLIMLEYLEKRPLVLMNIGMASKFVNYTRKKNDDDEDSDHECETGETVILEVNDDSPFLGEVAPGQTVRSFDNNLFRVPLAQHDPQPTDFLLIKSPDNQKLSIRPLPEVYCCGQIQPMMEVPAPNSRAANVFRKNRLQGFIYRFFKRKSPKYQKRLRIADVCSAFPWHSDAHVRKYLKQTADFQRGGDDSGWWTLKKNLKLPTEEQLQSTTSPEDVCLFESMRVGLNHLQNLGIEHMTKAHGIQTALESCEIHDKEMLAKIRRVEDELNLTPWSLTTNYIRAMQGRTFLKLTGFGSPFNGNGVGLSYINLPLKVQQSKQKQKQANIPKAPVTGTTSDLRKMSLEESRRTLLAFGLSEEEINSLKRWDRIGEIRRLSTLAAKSNENAGGFTKFARGTRHSTEQQKQDHKDKAQKIFEAQLAFISNTDADMEDLSSSSDDEDLFESIKNTMETTQDEQPTTLAPPQINSTPRPANPPPGTKWIKKITKIPNSDGSITRRIEIIRDVDKVEELMKKMQQNRQPNLKAHASAEEEQMKSQKRRERRRLQERLRRLKKNSEKQRKLQEQLINGTLDGSEEISVPLTCGACGMTGHMRTNRTCPLYREREQAKPVGKVKGTKIRISTKALDGLDEGEDAGKLTINIPKKAIEEADKLEIDRRPKKVQRGRRTETHLKIALNKVLEEIIGDVKGRQESFFFRNPVNEKDGAPGYYDIVKEPMYLGIVYRKCRECTYESVDEMLKDIDLIVSNCYAYNSGRNDYLLPVVDKFKQVILDLLEEKKVEIDEIEQQKKELESGKSLHSSTSSATTELTKSS